MSKALRVLVVGLGNMGLSHARAYDKLEGFELAGLCARSIAADRSAGAWSHVPRFTDYGEALAAMRPDVVSINTWPDTHADYAVRAIEAGAHVFVEKPLAQTVAEAQRVVDAARRHRRKLVVGYILRVHPSWTRLVELARTLGKPLVMRMNLNQQSIGPAWTWHRNLMQSLSPLVDCGVHYVDMMCQMTQSRPVRVHGIGAACPTRSRSTITAICTSNSRTARSAGTRPGWGPMMSEVAFFVKDVVGPKGAVSIVAAEQGATRRRRCGDHRLVRHRQPHQDQRDPPAPRRVARRQFAGPRRRGVPHGRRARATTSCARANRPTCCAPSARTSI